MIFGLIGKAGSGKDFAYEYFSDLGYSTARLGWADGLKEEIQDVLSNGIYMDALWRKPYVPEVRKFLQWWGTDLRRKEDPDYWVKKMKSDLVPFTPGGPMESTLALVTDCRFANEADAIRDIGGLVVRIWAPENIRRERLGTLAGAEHVSETTMDGFIADIMLRSINGNLTPVSMQDADLLATALSRVTSIYSAKEISR